MATLYPGALDTILSTLPDDKTDDTPTAGDHYIHHNNLADAVIAIETALGTSPAGSYSTVGAAVANKVDLSPTGAQVILPTADVVGLTVKQHNLADASNIMEWRLGNNAIAAYVDKSGIFSAQGLKIAGSNLASSNLSDGASLAKLASPIFTGSPSAPTAAVNTNTTQLATTAFVINQGYAPIASPTFTGTPATTAPADLDNSTRIPTTSWVNTAITEALASFVTVPAGAILMTGSASAPTGFLICDGSAVSRSTYATLFAVIGVQYGTGDGSTTFNLPDLRGRMPVGLGTQTDVSALAKSEGEVLANRRPKHKHTFLTNGNFLVPGGGFGSGSSGNSMVPATIGPQTNVPTDSPAYLVVNFIIKT